MKNQLHSNVQYINEKLNTDVDGKNRKAVEKSNNFCRKIKHPLIQTIFLLTIESVCKMEYCLFMSLD